MLDSAPRLSRRDVLLGAAAAAAMPAPSIAAAPAAPSRTGGVRVPVDHWHPASGEMDLVYEWGADYRPDVPTVLLVADAQQFYLRPGAAADLQAKLFGPGINVLALFGRGAAPAIKAFVRHGGATDWSRASRVLNVHQWIADLKLVADRLRIGPDKLALYGRSGGADLALRFIATHPARAARAYVQAAVTHDLAARWGVSADRFWEDLTARDKDAADRLGQLIASEPAVRRETILLLQRQNFYEPLDSLHEARIALIDAAVARDRSKLVAYRERYQLDALEAMRASGETFSAVRVHEFSRAYADPRGRISPLRPDVEAIFYYAEPVTRALYDVQVRAPYPELDALRRSSTELLILAGRHDHTSDYRTQIGLDGIARRSELLLLDDDHVFKRLGGSALHPALLQAFLGGGLRAAAYADAKAALAPLRWNENW